MQFLLCLVSWEANNNMSRITETNKKPLLSLHRNAVGGPMILAAIFFYFMQKNGGMIYDYKSKSVIIASVIVLLGILAANKFYNSNINNALSREFESYEKAIANFSISYLLRLVFVLIPTMIAIAMAASYSNPLIFIPALVGITYLFSSKLEERHFDNYTFK